MKHQATRQSMPQMNVELLKPVEFARRLNISTDCVYDMIKDHRILSSELVNVGNGKKRPVWRIWSTALKRIATPPTVPAAVDERFNEHQNALLRKRL